MAYRVEVSRRQFLGLAALAVAGASLGGLVGCSASSSKAADLEKKFKEGSDEVVEFVDSAGRRVILPKDIKTISPSGAYAQILLATLCPDKLVSLSGTFSKTQLRYLPERMGQLPALGRFYGKNGDMNYEELIKLNPDVIIDIGEAKDGIASDMDGLQKQTGIPVIYVQATMDCFASAYRTLGGLLGGQARAEEMASYIDTCLSFADSQRAQVDARDIRVMYSTGEYGYTVKEAGTVHSAVLERVGVHNVAQLEGANSTEVSPEQVLIWAPEVLLLSPADGYYDFIYEDAVWAGVAAVKNHRVYEVPTGPYEWLDQPPSIQTTLGVYWLGNLLCPDLYDLDMVAETQRFYQLFWGCTLSADEARELMAHSTFL